MIRIQVDTDALLNKIRSASPTWLGQAAQTKQFHRQQGRYSRPTPAWRRVKRVYVALQHGKCAYCERRLTKEEIEMFVWDVEHFRPKGAVAAWQPKNPGDRVGYTFGGGSSRGYYLLSHDPLNYASSCKLCNEILKACFFPVRARRRISACQHRALKREEPYLLYPVGSIDEDPEQVLRFDGIIPVPVTSKGWRHRRARVTIEIFRLADSDSLRYERAKLIHGLWLALEVVTAPGTPELGDHAQSIVNAAVDARTSHANCARSYVALYHQDRARAASHASLCRRLVDLDPG